MLCMVIIPSAPISKYKFSKLISIYFLKELVERICSELVERISADQRFSHQVIISLILTTFSLDYVLILLWENWLWSLLGLKGINSPFGTFLFCVPPIFFFLQFTIRKINFTCCIQCNFVIIIPQKILCKIKTSSTKPLRNCFHWLGLI